MPRSKSLRAKRRWKRPSWLWRWHHLLSVFVACAGIGMATASLQFGAPTAQVLASASENVMGWAWSDPSGWISLNSDNPSSCSPGPCGSYGVNLDPASKQISGFAWSDTAGWICFGSSCAASASCNGTPPAGALTASIANGAGTVEVHGWAKVCNEGNDGWISLNCSEPGVCASVSPYYRVVLNQSTGQFSDVAVAGSSFAWNGAQNGGGFGYIDFSQAQLRSETGAQCSDGIDNDGNGLKDCQEASCSSAPNCQEGPAQNNCADGIDNNLNGLTDCQEPACQADPVCAENPANGNKCSDGIDDNGNGLIDCADPSCAGSPSCAIAGEPACGAGADACCSDTKDNDKDGAIDCADLNCQKYAPVCTPAWLQAKYGNVYAQQGITAQTGAGGQPLSNATYCLTSQGAITGVTSQSNCTEAGSSSLTLPNATTGYKGTLGSIDIAGLLAGRYGQVVPFSGSLPAILEGKVYHATGNVRLAATTFQNASGATQRGNGVLLVEGTLTIMGDLSYQTNNLTQYLKNLASLGIIVKKDAQGNGGDIFIQPSVVNLVGAYFAENTIHTGTNGATDQPLKVLGLMAAFKFDLQRNVHSQTQAAESVIYDGRAAANPPPGMQDVSKSLPSSKDAF